MIEDLLEVEDTGVIAPVFFGPKQRYDLSISSKPYPEPYPDTKVYRLQATFFTEFRSTGDELELKVRNAKLQMKRRIYDDIISDLHDIISDPEDFEVKMFNLIEKMTKIKK